MEDNLNDIAGLHECHIKGYSSKFNDYGNCYFMYTGNNWEAARTDFRTMLYKDQKKPDRICNFYIDAEVYNLELNKLLNHINSFQIISDRIYTNSLCESEDDFVRRPFEHYPIDYPNLYFSDDDFSKHLNKKGNINKMVYKYCGERLVHLLGGNDDIEINSIAKDGFIWVSTDKSNQKFKYMIEIRPHYLDEIYVAELGIAEDYRQECFKTAEYLSNNKYNRYIRLRGVKIVTFKEYKRDNLHFKIPQILIRKEIGYDEIVKIEI